MISLIVCPFQDFLRQNNTGKLLWQIFGVQAASLSIFGIIEHEEIMWNEFIRAGFCCFFDGFCYNTKLFVIHILSSKTFLVRHVKVMRSIQKYIYGIM